MRAKRIYFRGYRRLADTECDITPRLLAFVGQNEAGKSSILSALEWLSEEEPTAIEPLDRSRADRDVGGWMVGVRFDLESDDLAELEALDLAAVPKSCSLWKQDNGSVTTSPREVKDLARNPEPFVSAHDALVEAASRLTKQLDASPEDFEGDEHPKAWVPRVLEALTDPDREWSKDDEDSAGWLVEWLEETPEGRKNPRDSKTAGLIRQASRLGRFEHPRHAAIRLFKENAPRFVQFRETDRNLPTLNPGNGRTVSLSPAVRNLFKVAEVDAQDIWRAHLAGDTGEVETLCDRAHARLDAFFSGAWNQSKVSVRFRTSADGLLVHVVELETRRFTRLEERSDGLRAFIALAAFIEAQQLDVPPILLIDEAETHLHINAQADLVGVLLRQVKASQVIYTTHSPGCLPSDLGTGIRLVERVDEATSQIRSHFWTNEAPGFSPLLYAMGASAAAFSACRYAVLAEGAGDMVLLPTLIREATGATDLEYQVAPGLSNARAFDMKVEEIAAKVQYLTDGDEAGRRYRDDLMGLAKVPEGRIHALPDGWTAEDLIDPVFLIDTIRRLVPDAEPAPTIDEVDLEQPIMAQLSAWVAAGSGQRSLPGKVAIAYAVVEQAKVRLREGAGEALIDIHKALMSGFEN